MSVNKGKNGAWAAGDLNLAWKSSNSSQEVTPKWILEDTRRQLGEEGVGQCRSAVPDNSVCQDPEAGERMGLFWEMERMMLARGWGRSHRGF